MTDNEIIKALECCRTANCFDCRNCPYKGKYDNAALYRDCCNLLMNDALDIINRQKAEIERVKDLNNVLETDTINANMNLEHLQHEFDLLEQEKSVVVAEAVKEFAARLEIEKETTAICCDTNEKVVRISDIDDFVKEFTEGK